jgi:adenylate kinase family enzyme
LLAQRLELPHLELDSLYHQSGWNSLSTDEFRARVEKFTGQDEWVVDGNYISQLGDITWGGADSIVWMDTPRLVATARVVRRTLGRVLLRTELWNGNREDWRQVLSRDPERSIVVWSWKMHDKYTDRYETAMKDPRWSHIGFVRLRTRREVRRFLRSLGSDNHDSTTPDGARSSPSP